MIQRILVGYDGSEASIRAINYSLHIAKATNASLHILLVVHRPSFGSDAKLEMQRMTNTLRLYRKLTARVIAKSNMEDINAISDIVAGRPANQIVARANALNVDMIIMGRRKRSSLSRWLLGSVSHWVMSHTNCPVILVL